MDAAQTSAGIYALALTLAGCMTPEEMARLALILTQLGTTLATMSGLQSLEAGGRETAAETER